MVTFTNVQVFNILTTMVDQNFNYYAFERNLDDEKLVGKIDATEFVKHIYRNNDLFEALETLRSHFHFHGLTPDCRLYGSDVLDDNGKLGDDALHIPYMDNTDRISTIRFSGGEFGSRTLWDTITNVSANGLPKFNSIVSLFEPPILFPETESMSFDVKMTTKGPQEVSFDCRIFQIIITYDTSERIYTIEVKFDMLGDSHYSNLIFDKLYLETQLFGIGEIPRYFSEDDIIYEKGNLVATHVLGNPFNLQNYKPDTVSMLVNDLNSHIGKLRWKSIDTNSVYFISKPPAIQDNVMTLTTATREKSLTEFKKKYSIGYDSINVYFDPSMKIYADEDLYLSCQEEFNKEVQVLPVDNFGYPILPVGSTAILMPKDGDPIEIVTVPRT